MSAEQRNAPDYVFESMKRREKSEIQKKCNVALAIGSLFKNDSHSDGSLRVESTLSSNCLIEQAKGRSTRR